MTTTRVSAQPSHQESGAAVAAATVRTNCRVCGSEQLLPILSLGNQYVSNFVDQADTLQAQAPLELVLCSAHAGGCGLLQLRHTVDQGALYRNYWYRSGVNQTMQLALRDICAAAEQRVSLKSGDLVVDIGSNDGTLLKSYAPTELKKIGFEPATNLLPYANVPGATIINDFFTVAPFKLAAGEQRAKIITSIAMFYDLDDPNTFVSDIAHALDSNGLWIIQMSYLPLMLEHNVFDNICHEHLEYYSLLSLMNLLERHGLKVVDVELNDVNGGSFRIYITHASNQEVAYTPAAQERITSLITHEKTMGLDTPTTYQDFAQRVAAIKDSVASFIRQEVAAGKTVYVYGASTKGNTLLQYFDLNHELITAAAERNPDKWGKATVGTLIPIVSEAEARAAQPDYFLVLPWHFLREFVEREHEYLKNGGKFIVPLPQFKVIGAEAVA
ncbi:MAG: class I SAM-dependent methyltransferase [Candidatus Andersenbacteria bacterium]